MQSFKKYIYNTQRIRTLSTPALSRVKSPSEYENMLQYNFREIGFLADENRQILKDVFFPIINDKKSISPEEFKELMEVYDELINGEKMENLDVPLANIISGFLMENMPKDSDAETIIKVCDMHATSCYIMMNFSKRTYPFSDICEVYRKQGMDACDIILSYLKPEKWDVLPNNEIRELVLNLSRYKAVFYEGIDGNFEANESEMDIIRRSLELSFDSRYNYFMKKDDLEFYRLCAYEYFGFMLEVGNKRGLTHSQCFEIDQHMQEMEKLWETNPTVCEKRCDRASDELVMVRGHFHAGKLSFREYKDILLEIYKTRHKEAFNLDDIFVNMLLPLEYIRLLEGRAISEKEYAILETFYRNVFNYILNLPNSGGLVYTLEYLVQLLTFFTEVPGGTTFEEIGLNCLAALHPPTYVHSKMVASISRCLTKHLLRLHPEFFFDYLGIDDEEEVKSRRDELTNFAYHAALCHDFGKIGIIDTIFVYGRSIQDPEFEQIKSHPELGALFIQDNLSTAAYTNIAKGHHRWYNDKRGYPDGFITADLPEKVFIDIVCCADCMDAATDTTGRSYNKGKTLEEFIGEIKEGAGERYAPFLVELLENDETRKDLEFLLSQVRNDINKDTFVMLRKLQRLGA